MPAPGLIRRNVNAAELSGRMGWWGSYMPIGSAIGLLLGPWVLQATSWQAWWIALGCSSLLAFIAVWRMVPADAARISASATPAVADSGSNGWRPRLALTLRSPGPWLVSLAFMLYSGQWMGVVGFCPPCMRAGLSAKLAGMLTAVVAAANMVGNIASGKLMQRGWSPVVACRSAMWPWGCARCWLMCSSAISPWRRCGCALWPSCCFPRPGLDSRHAVHLCHASGTQSGHGIDYGGFHAAMVLRGAVCRAATGGGSCHRHGWMAIHLAGHGQHVRGRLVAGPGH